MSVNLIPYEPWHLMAMFDKNNELLTVDDVQFIAVVYKNRGTAYTAMEGNKILGCAGIVRLWGNVGETWSYLSDDFRAKPFALHKICKQMLRQVKEVSGYHRVQTTVRKDDKKAIKWAEKLGMTYESTLKQFGPDKADYDMFCVVT
jgi:RimJ/RimL family protein N-acetyltransferase